LLHHAEETDTAIDAEHLLLHHAEETDTAIDAEHQLLHHAEETDTAIDAEHQLLHHIEETDTSINIVIDSSIDNDILKNTLCVKIVPPDGTTYESYTAHHSWMADIKITTTLVRRETFLYNSAYWYK
jgi:hypothetical protein